MKHLFKIFLVICFVAFTAITAKAATDSTCVADFSYEIYGDMNRPNIIQFTNLSSGEPSSYLWDFGDGSTSENESPIHQFPANGKYVVKLTASNNTSSDEMSKTIIIDVSITLNFTYKLDSNNIVPNTFIFNVNVDGPYDYLEWNFGDQIILDNTTATHSYASENTDYQVILTAIFIFNDTSLLKKSLVKGLTTYEYFDLGGQVILGDSLMNNPYSTNDTGIAVLYRLEDYKLQVIDTNHFYKFGYYWFKEKLKAQYIVQVFLSDSSKHYYSFAPTYIGNTTSWEEADIINLSQDKYREDVKMVETGKLKNGDISLTGLTSELMTSDTDEEVIICLYNTDGNLIDFKKSHREDSYTFNHLSKGHYLITTDLAGIESNSELIFIDVQKQNDFKSNHINPIVEIFPNPAFSYTILTFDNHQKLDYTEIQLMNSNGLITKNLKVSLKEGMNYIHIDLSDLSKGLFFIKLKGSESNFMKLIHL